MEAINEHLFRGLVPAVIHADRNREYTDNSGDNLFRSRRQWDPIDAQRWLSYLAHCLEVSEKPDRTLQPHRNIAWWHLHRVVPLHPIKLAAPIVAGPAFGLTLGPIYALIFAFVGALLILLGQKAEAQPQYADLRLRGLVRQIPTRLKLSFRFTIPIGIVSVPIFTLIVGFGSAILVGLTYAFVGGIAFTLSDSIATPSIPDTRASTPLSTLRNDRAMTVVHILAVGLTNALALGFAFGVWFGTFAGIMWTLMATLGTSIRVPIYRQKAIHVPIGFSAVGTAWASYILTKIFLSTTRKFPVRLMGFLDDCCRLGLLKQEGPWYQFRHAELQDWLALAHR